MRIFVVGAAAGLVVALVMVFVVRSDEQGPPPVTAVVGLEPLAGFGTGTLVLDGVTELPVMVADTDDLRASGLMSVTDLGDFAGMVFVWDVPTDGGFWMKHTLIPLTIFWFDDSGAVVATAEMTPCPPDETDCPKWKPSARYTMALEVPTAIAGELGFTSVTTLELRR